jgi:hypothetical protein
MAENVRHMASQSTPRYCVTLPPEVTPNLFFKLLLYFYQILNDLRLSF